MTACYRIRCAGIGEARHAVDRLLRAGVAASSIKVLSSEPIHDLGEQLAGKSRLSWIVPLGALLGAAAGYGMAAGTALLYPLNTGGMPIVSQAPIGIVTYEAMMLLAILFTLAGVLLEGRLLRPRSLAARELGGALADGEVVVLVESEHQGDITVAEELGGVPAQRTAPS